jgi:hypothetical protein
MIVYFKWDIVYEKQKYLFFFIYICLFCFSILTIFGVYILFGVAYRRLIGGAKGFEQIPHYGFWKELGNLQAVCWY